MMINRVFVGQLVLCAFLAAVLGSMAGCVVLKRDFEAHKTIVAKETVTLKTALAVAKESAARAETVADEAKTKVATATTMADEAKAEARKAKEAADKITKDYTGIRNVIDNGIAPRLGGVEVTTNKNDKRLMVLDKDDLPALKKDVAALQDKCKALETTVDLLTDQLGQEEKARKKLEADLVALSGKLAGETTTRKNQEGIQATVNEAVKENAALIAKSGKAMESLQGDMKELDTSLDKQNGIIKHLDESFDDLLSKQKKLFNGLLNAAMAITTPSVDADVTTTQPAKTDTILQSNGFSESVD